jgi:hypothetical protein
MLRIVAAALFLVVLGGAVVGLLLYGPRNPNASPGSIGRVWGLAILFFLLAGSAILPLLWRIRRAKRWQTST